jgi:hypothetical protein
MKRQIHKIPLLLLTSIVLSNFQFCRKAGNGGKADVSIYVKHHANPIAAAMVYVKYNQKEFPGPDLKEYDDSVKTGSVSHALGHVHLHNLKKGYYYFYALGFDSAISEKVTGGVCLHISFNERKKDLTLEIPVTE